ncbi:ParA family protein [Microbacterium pygmaeum]|uniref:Cellulose biosynthesis protein BcsQ n=1 Tax=Microbacterium pygmaeum TaxID=370764 RepID=A0A1G7U5F7_9MICO|nr:ParA family protein [Microbacterium pygmaeum]SDG41990.1 Cellulose biosynthesis protein BcsQ [Microbacterium pygmaeum]
MKVIAVYSVKGGVGKSTTAVNLAWEAASKHRVLLWDLDPQGSATFLLDVKPKLRGGAEALLQGRSKIADAVRATGVPGLDVLPGDESYRDLELVLDQAKHSEGRIDRALGSLSGDYDVIVLDCPPGSSLLAQNVIRAADVVVLPLVPSPLSARSLEQVRDIVRAEKHPPAVLAFLSMVDRRKTAHRAAIENLAAVEPEVIDVAVPHSVVVERMGYERVPVGASAPSSEAARAYATLWKAVWSQVSPAKAGKS